VPSKFIKISFSKFVFYLTQKDKGIILIKKGEILKLEITDYAFEGKGIARIALEENGDKNFIVFVKGAYPGDVVEARIIKKKKSFAEARIVKHIQSAKDRVFAKCKYFGSCGGCKQQDLDYQKQLFYKEEQVKDIFERLGGFTDFEILPILSSENQFYYRNKMEFSFADKRWIPKEEFDSGEEIKDRNFALGLHIPRIFDKVLDIDECFLQSELSNKIVNFTRDFFKERNVSIYSTKTHEGFLRNLVIRQAFHSDDVMVNLVTSSEDKNLMEEFSNELINKIPEVTTVINNVNLRKAQVAVGDFENVYFGNGVIYDSIGEYKFRISANSFFQTNTLQGEKLYQTALDFADFSGDEIVYDLYSGAGTISAFISKNVKKVYGVEAVDSAVKDAKSNAKLNNISNTEFLKADLNRSFLPIIEHKNIPKPDLIIADPPRSGMNPKTVKDILRLNPGKIVYVSCNPTTQVRDIKTLVENGYKLIKIKPVDMFPNTYHIENVALLIKTEAKF